MVKNIQKMLGDRIKKLRKIKGYSQEKFAENIDISTTSLSLIETGKGFMTMGTLEKIVEILDISPQELFKFDDKTSAKELHKEALAKINFIKNDPEKLKILNAFADILI